MTRHKAPEQWTHFCKIFSWQKCVDLGCCYWYVIDCCSSYLPWRKKFNMSPEVLELTGKHRNVLSLVWKTTTMRWERNISNRSISNSQDCTMKSFCKIEGAITENWDIPGKTLQQKCGTCRLKHDSESKPNFSEIISICRKGKKILDSELSSSFSLCGFCLGFLLPFLRLVLLIRPSNVKWPWKGEHQNPKYPPILLVFFFLCNCSSLLFLSILCLKY